VDTSILETYDCNSNIAVMIDVRTPRLRALMGERPRSILTALTSNPVLLIYQLAFTLNPDN